MPILVIAGRAFDRAFVASDDIDPKILDLFISFYNSCVFDNFSSIPLLSDLALFIVVMYLSVKGK